MTQSGTNETRRDLFGGAMTATIPVEFSDVSDFRQVPDNQEVFADPRTDQSIIIEILELHEEASDADCARWHFENLADENDVQPGADYRQISMVRPLANIDAPNVIPVEQSDDNVAGMLAIGTIRVAKYRQGDAGGESVLNTVNLYVAVLRLKQFSADVLVSMNHPMAIGSQSAVQSEGARADPDVTKASKIFMSLLRSFRIVDSSLFG
ncbi:Mog1p/PsbP-like protein [Ramicandelaber brevisporus]|nr:Mog1p/PsbP-like protein [Ramicandelaber brevisporus]